jgi:predicted metal-dependent phosphoesterase TrpH
MFCDLHVHSTASDGTVPPEDLGAMAKAAGLGAIALTDHDTTAGLDACAAGCRRADVEFVPGVEISCDPGSLSGEMHILGYFIDPQNQTLSKLLAKQETARVQRVPRIVEKLNELGIDVTLDQVQTAAAGAMVGRPHVARVLIDKGYVKTVQDAFVRYLRSDAPAFVPKQRAKAPEAIDAIHAAGGLASLAHASLLRCANDAELTQAIAQLAEAGLDALEAWHDDHTAAMVEKCRAFAKRFDLLITGGSDYHGANKSVALGSQRVPYEVYEQLTQAHAGGKAKP